MSPPERAENALGYDSRYPSTGLSVVAQTVESPDVWELT